MRRFVTLILLFAAGTAAAQTLPFKLYDGYLVTVQCSAAGRPNLTAVIDTGVSETVIDLALARSLGLQLRSDKAVFVNKEAAVWAATIPQIELGPITADSLDGIATDLSALKGKLGVHPDLLIGMDLLHRSNFEIDYKSHLLTFGAVPMLTHQAMLSGNERFVLVDSTISGKAVRFQVDTGLNGILLYAKRLVFNDRGQSGAHLMGVSDSSALRATDAEVRIGAWRSRGSPISVLDTDPAAGYFDGLLGARALTSSRIAFDFRNEKVFWD